MVLKCLVCVLVSGLAVTGMGCAADDESVGEWSGAGWIANGLSPDEFDNAISANQTALALLATSSLDSLGSHAYLTRQLFDPDARTYMEYVVSCALPAGASVSFTDANISETYTFFGALGLHAGWKSAAPTGAGLRRVSACVLSRVNAYDVEVIISLRGQPAALFPLGPNELSDFQVEEGSFYGNIFQLGAGIDVHIDPSYNKVIELPSPPVRYYPNMWACTNPSQMAQYVAYMVDRVCTAEGCVAEPVGSCAVRCSVQDGAQVTGDGDNEHCEDRHGVVWHEVVTTFMHASCAMVDPQCP